MLWFLSSNLVAEFLFAGTFRLCIPKQKFSASRALFHDMCPTSIISRSTEQSWHYTWSAELLVPWSHIVLNTTKILVLSFCSPWTFSTSRTYLHLDWVWCIKRVLEYIWGRHWANEKLSHLPWPWLLPERSFLSSVQIMNGNRSKTVPPAPYS